MRGAVLLLLLLLLLVATCNSCTGSSSVSSNSNHLEQQTTEMILNECGSFSWGFVTSYSSSSNYSNCRSSSSNTKEVAIPVAAMLLHLCTCVCRPVDAPVGLTSMSRERVNRKLRHPAANSHLILAQKLGQFPMCPTSWKMMQQLKQQQEQQEQQQQHQQQQLLKSSSSRTYQVQGCQDPY
uniref:HDC13464 n=1 Tax=Drosophila melanogaster TaxID=7227 RepID=Q6IK38_DROME|nr:TPA_inf: HDC13464 [Drosophila melanogaster]